MVHIGLKEDEGAKWPMTIMFTIDEFKELDGISTDIAMLLVSGRDGWNDVKKVKESYPALCSSTYKDQLFFGDIATMILYNCFLELNYEGEGL